MRRIQFAIEGLDFGNRAAVSDRVRRLNCRQALGGGVNGLKLGERRCEVRAGVCGQGLVPGGLPVPGSRSCTSPGGDDRALCTPRSRIGARHETHRPRWAGGMSGAPPHRRRPDVFLPPECRELIDRGALVVKSSSGGKDSQAITILLCRIVPREQLLVVHAPLDEVEWPGTLAHVESTMPPGVPLILARAASGKSLSNASKSGANGPEAHFSRQAPRPGAQTPRTSCRSAAAPQRPVPGTPVCGGDKLVHGSGGDCPAAAE